MRKITAKVVRTTVITEEANATLYIYDGAQPTRKEIENKILSSVSEDTKFNTTYRNSKLSVLDVKDSNQPTLPIF